MKKYVKKDMKILAIRWSLFIVGIIFFSLGISLTINVQHLGIQSWDVLNVGLYDLFGLTIGTWAIIISLILVGIAWVLDKSYIQIGTIINAFAVGLFVDFFLWLDILPKATHTWTDGLTIIAGIIIMGLAGGMYNAGGIGSGPRDGFMLSLSDKWGMSIGKVRIIIETSVLVIGLLIGGPIFIFSILFTFIQSPLFQCSFVRFNHMVHKIELRLKERAS